LLQQQPLHPPKSPIATAIRYGLNQWRELGRFLDDAAVPLDNNASERSLRRVAVGRKNWLFVGNDDAGAVNAGFVSLLASCQMHGLEPWAYLREVFSLLPRWPRSRVLELAPASWKQTLEQDDTHQRLAADVFRRASLAPADHHRDQT
jgi:hypothetical protein